MALAAGTSLTPVVPNYEYSDDIPDDPDALLTELRGQIDAQKIGDLLDTIQQESLQVIIRQFGLGSVLFSDMMGGNVATVHNVRNDDYVGNPNTAYTKTGEAVKYDGRGDYNSSDYHGEKRYILKNKSTQEAFEKGILKDSYGSGVLRTKNLDHVKSAKEIHDDRARVLAEISGPDLANQDSNLKATSETINKSKKQKSAKEFLEWVETTKLPDLEKKIRKIENKGDITDADRLELDKLKSSKKQFENIDKNKVLEADKIARQNIDRDINRKYYQSEKFLGQVAKTSLEEGGKMGLQQALGVLMEEFVRAVFEEIKDAWRNGFKDKIDDTFFSALKVRLLRVAERVQGKWRDAVQAFKDGAISGMFSNIITVI
ncbi:MAG: lactate permease, partial [Oligoflexus sp.]